MNKSQIGLDWYCFLWGKGHWLEKMEENKRIFCKDKWGTILLEICTVYILFAWNLPEQVFISMEQDRRLGSGDYKYKTSPWNLENLPENSPFVTSGREKLIWLLHVGSHIFLSLPPLTVMLPQYDSVHLPKASSNNHCVWLTPPYFPVCLVARLLLQIPQAEVPCVTWGPDTHRVRTPPSQQWHGGQWQWAPRAGRDCKGWQLCASPVVEVPILAEDV
jgi:hypothetical protein